MSPMCETSWNSVKQNVKPMSKKKQIQGYLNSLNPYFSQSGDTLTLTLKEGEESVSTMIFSVHIMKGTFKPISQRVIQLKDVDTIKLLDKINEITPLKEKDMKVVRMEILNYSRELVNEFFAQ